jgi:hypothetical protein
MKTRMNKHRASGFDNRASLGFGDAILMVGPNSGQGDRLILLVQVIRKLTMNENVIVAMVVADSNTMSTH